ncbi:MAG: FeoB-associated Cys-rich membrane protein [Oscillospiraceae bacterium]|jgi:hypothetical protein|nr:FeoB-associated Cys-rich membrane protein [Oscillospiraceae bacterium]
MFDFIVQNLGSILVGAAVAAIVVLIIVKLVRDRKRGVSCASCGGCAGCHPGEDALCCGRGHKQ